MRNSISALTITVGIGAILFLGCDDTGAPTTTTTVPDAGPIIDMTLPEPEPDPPTASAVGISPEMPKIADTLECTWTFADPAMGEDASTVAWTVNGDPAGEGASLSGAFVRGDEVTCMVTPSNGTSAGTPASATTTIVNSMPVASEALIEPAEPTAYDPLRCGYVFSDADGDPQGETITWTINGEDAGEGPNLVTGYAKGDRVTCRITPTDGIVDGELVSVSVDVLNTLPAIPGVTLEPEVVREADVLTCVADEVVDPDGEDIELAYSWTVADLPVEGDTDTLTGTQFDRGDIVVCTVTPTDASGAGEPTRSNPVTIQNTAPTLESATLGPEGARVQTPLVCVPGATADADPADMAIEVAIAWRVNRMPVEGINDTLEGAFARDDEVVCVVTPTDGTDEGAAVSSNTITIANTPPTVAEVGFEPNAPVANEAVRCIYAFADADLDRDRSTIAWTLNDAPAGEGEVFEGDLVEGDVLTCTVTPSDGSDAGAPSSAEVTIGNTPPSIGEVLIFPLRDAFTSESLRCEGQNIVDPDAHQEIVVAYAWTINEEPIEVVEDTLPADRFVRDDIITCTVTVSDPFGDGGTATSADKVIVNSAPTIGAADIEPRRARPNDVLTCVYEGFADADDDDDFSTITWTVNDEPVEGEGNQLAGVFDAEDEVVCEVTAHDGIDPGEVRRGRVTIDPFVVTDATLHCVSPGPGAMLTVAPGGAVQLEGRVSEIEALTSLTVDDQEVEWAEDGTFSAQVTAGWGLNVHQVVIRDARGNSNRTFCSYFAAEHYHPEDQPLSDAVILDITQAGVDDGDGGDDDIRSLTDLLRRVVNSPGLVDLMDGSFRSSNPLSPNQCHQEVCFIGCSCILHSEVNYTGLSIRGRNTVSITLLDGGMRINARFNNMRIGLRVSGTFNTTGHVDVAHLSADMSFAVRLVNGRPNLTVTRVNNSDIGGLDSSFSGVTGFIVDLIFPVVEGILRREANTILAGYLATEMNETIGGVLGGLDVNAVGGGVAVPGFGGAPNTNLNLALGFSRLDASPARLKLGLNSRFTAPTQHDLASAGVPLPPGNALVDAVGGGTMGAAVYFGLMNQALHALWRAGIFEMQDPGELLGDLPEGFDVSVRLLAPPAVRGLVQNGDATRVEFHLGPIVGSVAVGDAEEEPLEVRAVAIVTAPVLLLAGQDIAFGGEEGLNVEQLHFTFDGVPEDAQGQGLLEDNFRRLAQQIVDESLANALPRLPIPDFAVPADIPGVGGTRLGLRNPALRLTDSHLLLDGTFGQ